MSVRGVTQAIGLTALLAPGLAACAVDEGAPCQEGALALAVQPRVVMDGLVQLGAREDRILVDEVLFHAPTVTLRDGEQVLEDVLATDPLHHDALLFRYEVTSADGFGDVLGGERSWSIGGRGDLVFGFEPFNLDSPRLQKLEGATQVNLEELVGHTAVVHGYMMRSAATSTGFSKDPLEGDPDGNPAQTADQAEGDPDGNPADTEGDPDGNPAHPKGEGDPDGNPSQNTESRAKGHHIDHGLVAQSGNGLVGVHSHGRAQERVPFFLVLDATFPLRVPVDGLAPVGADEVLPIDLHVQLDALITDDLLAQLDAQATDSATGAIVVQLPDASAVGIDVQTAGVKHRAREAATSSGIRVVGDRR